MSITEAPTTGACQQQAGGFGRAGKMDRMTLSEASMPLGVLHPPGLVNDQAGKVAQAARKALQPAGSLDGQECLAMPSPAETQTIAATADEYAGFAVRLGLPAEYRARAALVTRAAPS